MLFKRHQKISTHSTLINTASNILDLTREQNLIAQRALVNRDVGQIDRFLLFRYDAHLPMFDGYINYGDYIQTIATKMAIRNTFNPSFDFADRDSLFFYSAGGGGVHPYLHYARMVFSHIKLLAK